MRAFAEVYGGAASRGARSLRVFGEVVIPAPLPRYCGRRVLAMDWLDGEPLLPEGAARSGAAASAPSAQELAMVDLGISSTLSQLLVTGTLHADQHAGNLLRLPPKKRTSFAAQLLKRPPVPRIGYLDFGIVSHVPLQVREALVCAVAYLLFQRDVSKLASLFDELLLLPSSALAPGAMRDELEARLDTVATRLLGADDWTEGCPVVPTLRFDDLVASLALLAPAFPFELPPFFANNARALASLEGIARQVDPCFNLVRAVYPFAIQILLEGGREQKSERLRSTLRDLTVDDATGLISVAKVRRLVFQLADLSGKRKRMVILDVLRTRGGREIARALVRQNIIECGRRAVVAWRGWARLWRGRGTPASRAM